MADTLKPIDVTDLPELRQLAEEVHQTHVPHLLRQQDKDLALVVPLPQPQKAHTPGKKPTAADREAFRRAAGSWADVDTDALIDNIHATRRRSNRPPLDL